MPAKSQAKRNKPKGPSVKPSSLTGKGGSNGMGNLRVSQAGAYAALSSQPMRIGMSDLLRHKLSWLIGYIYVGNGTLGATDSVYLVDPSKTYVVVPVGSSGSGGCNVPVLPFDTVYGAVYASDVMKHYARVRYSRGKLCILSLNPATTNQMTVTVAPKRGASSIGLSSTSTTASLTQTEVWSMAGQVNLASWQTGDVDLTKFIAGGAGAMQDEFDTSLGEGGSNATGNYDPVARQVVPCTFAVSGNNSTTSLRGTVTHAVIGEVDMTLLDFIGGNYPISVDALRARSIVRSASPQSADDKSEVVHHTSKASLAMPPLRRSDNSDTKSLNGDAVFRSSGRVDIGQDYYFVRKANESAAAPLKTTVPAAVVPQK